MALPSRVIYVACIFAVCRGEDVYRLSCAAGGWAEFVQCRCRSRPPSPPACGDAPPDLVRRVTQPRFVRRGSRNGTPRARGGPRIIAFTRPIAHTCYLTRCTLFAHALRYKHSTIHNAYVKNGSRAPLPNGREPTPGKCKVGNKISGIRARWRCKPRPRRRVRLTLVLRPPNHGMRPEAPRSSFRSSGRELSMCNRRVVARELSM